MRAGGDRQPDCPSLSRALAFPSLWVAVCVSCGTGRLCLAVVTCLFLESLQTPLFLSEGCDSLTSYQTRKLAFILTTPAPRQHVQQFYTLNVSGISPVFSRLCPVFSGLCPFPPLPSSCLDSGSSLPSLCLHSRPFSIHFHGEVRGIILKCLSPH